MAFTATKNVPLAATTTGSWPRPAWYSQSLWGRPLDTPCSTRSTASSSLMRLPCCFRSGACGSRYCDVWRLLSRCGFGGAILASLSAAALARGRL